MIRSVLVLCLALAGGQVAALTPLPPTCWFEPGHPEAEFGQYEPEHIGNGFVAFETLSDIDANPDLVFVLEYCPVAQQLVVTVPDYDDNPALAASVEEMFDTMLYGSATYTMTQIGDALAGLGADAGLRTVDYQSCACATFGE